MRINTELQISLKRLQENFSLIQDKAKNCEIIFMVKANAYGHGMVECAKFAYESVGIRHFGVAALGEALELRKAITGTDYKVLVFSELDFNDPASVIYQEDEQVIPVISNLIDLDFLLKKPELKNKPLYLKFNTGMNRLGVHWKDVSVVIERLKGHGRNSIEHLMTHFACSYIPSKEGDRTSRQYKIFLDIKKELEAAGIKLNDTSVANSGAIEQGIGLEESHIRPGIMLYGAKSFPKSSWEGNCISKLKTYVLKIEPIKKGVPVGYGAHVCHDDGHLIYLPIGYGDGVLTYYSGKDITWHGKTGRILGRVNMDLTAIFFKELPDAMNAGDDFYFWDGQVSQISEMSHQFKTTPYQLFTGISQRVPRRYLS